MPYAAALGLAAGLAAPAGAGAPDGATVYAAACATCHGASAQSGAGGDIRGLAENVYLHALRGVDQMPRVDLTEEEAAAVAAWLAAL